MMDYSMLRTLEYLAENPVNYEPRYPIRAIERALRAGLAKASTESDIFFGRKHGWRRIAVIKLTDKGKQLLKGTC